MTKAALPAGKGRELVLSIRPGLKDEDVAVPMTKLCKKLGVARRTTHYKSTKVLVTVNSTLVEIIHEQEHRAADLLTQGLAGAKARYWSASANRSEDFARRGAGSVMGYGFVPALGWHGRLAQPGAGDRLWSATVAGMAPVVNR
ncbi:hypothetical protein [Stenotrophomonas sp. 24(2023)]|uniref:hypothetical protein n=1 Tax=Stenotrophomonas sp. 24(2023) TaxID=3068324 RepID=UPI0027DFE8FB|nr:hypothetical protein [Stenotrophomonas sp. 24(2023)]WMJ67632.1 hypothetical protein Q9R17_10375 [Stenotrophomonas sp. 24(2023)]